MKNAKEIKFERSFTASRSIKQIKKNTDRLYTLLKVLNENAILPDSDFFILLTSLNSYSIRISEFESIFFDSKNTTIVKNHKNLEVIEKNNEHNKIITQKLKIFLNASDKNIPKIKKTLIEILKFLKINYEYNIQNLKEELKKIYNIIVLYEIYDIIDGILEKICKI
jgi:hypothetical protein